LSTEGFSPLNISNIKLNTFSQAQQKAYLEIKNYFENKKAHSLSKERARVRLNLLY
jgi:hypothetical protein